MKDSYEVDIYKRTAKMTGQKINTIKEISAVLFENIAETLAWGDNVRVNKFGVFESKVRQPRKGYNPRTGEILDLPAKRYASFKPAKHLRDLMEEE